MAAAPNHGNRRSEVQRQGRTRLAKKATTRAGLVGPSVFVRSSREKEQRTKGKYRTPAALATGETWFRLRRKISHEIKTILKMDSCYSECVIARWPGLPPSYRAHGHATEANTTACSTEHLLPIVRSGGACCLKTPITFFSDPALSLRQCVVGARFAALLARSSCRG